MPFESKYIPVLSLALIPAFPRLRVYVTRSSDGYQLLLLQQSHGSKVDVQYPRVLWMSKNTQYAQIFIPCCYRAWDNNTNCDYHLQANCDTSSYWFTVFSLLLFLPQQKESPNVWWIVLEGEQTERLWILPRQSFVMTNVLLSFYTGNSNQTSGQRKHEREYKTSSGKSTF